MPYIIYVKISKEDRFGAWDGKEYKTRNGAEKALTNLRKIHGKAKKYKWGTMPGTQFKIVKKPDTKKISRGKLNLGKERKKSKGFAGFAEGFF